MTPIMSPRYRSLLRACLLALPVSLVFPLAQTAQAANTDGTWTLPAVGPGSASGSWNTAGNWSGSTIADGSGFTANFNSVNPTGILTTSNVITLDAIRTIGNITFGDTDTSTPSSWNLNAGTGSPALTLAGTTPTITVNSLGVGGVAQINAVIAGNNGLTKVGGTGATVASAGTAGLGVLVLNGVNTYTGGTTISSGALRASNNSALGNVSSAVTVTSGAQLQLGGVTLGNTVNLNGSSALFVSSGSNTLSGTVNLQSNSTVFNTTTNNNGVDFSGTVNLNGFTLSIAMAQSASSGKITGTVTGTGGITKSSTSDLIISGTNTYTGATIISGGALKLGNGGTTGSLSTSSTITDNGNLTINRSNAVAQGTDFSGSAITGTGSFTQAGSGTTTLTAANTYTGATTISAGTLSVGTIGNGGVASNLGQASTAAANLVFNGGTLQYTGSSASTNRNFTINAGKTATFDVTTNNLTVSGASTATTGALNKIGNGTLTLAGANAHTGGTTVSLGTLVAANASALGSTTGDTTVSGGTLTSTVANVNLGNLTLSGGSLDANSTSIGSYTLANGKNFVFSAGTFNSTLVGALTSDRLIGSGAGTFSITGGALVLDVTNGGFGGYGVAYTLLNGFSSGTVSGLNISGYDTINWLAVLGSNGVLSFSAVAVPEPSTYAMVAGAGLLAFAFWRRRRTCA